MRTVLTIAISLLVIGLVCVGQQTGGLCGNVTYENRNQVDCGPLQVATISGAATDIQGVAVPNVCVGVFTETDHKFIAAAQINDSGRFELKNVPDGNYRLVAKYEGFAPANARIHVNRHSRSKKPLASHIRLAGIDTTSYFESKERYDYFPVRQ